jgi:hypothetical protein
MTISLFPAGIFRPFL